MPKRLVDIYVRHFKDQPFYVTLNTLAAVVFTVFFILWVHQNNQLNSQARSAKTLAAKTHKLAKQNSILLNKVQNNRRDLIYKSCQDQNKRHDDSLTALRKLLSKSGVSKARQDQSFKQTKILINALVPHRNCVALANDNVKPANTKPKASN